MPATAEVVYTFTVTVFPTTTLGSENITSVAAALALTLPGMPPTLIAPPAGDAFAYRNDQALAIDYEEAPPMFQITPTHAAATWLLDPRAPKVEMPPELKDRVARMSAEAKKIEEAE